MLCLARDRSCFGVCANEVGSRHPKSERFRKTHHVRGAHRYLEPPLQTCPAPLLVEIAQARTDGVGNKLSQQWVPIGRLSPPSLRATVQGVDDRIDDDTTKGHPGLPLLLQRLVVGGNGRSLL